MEVVLNVTDPVTAEQQTFTCPCKELCSKSKFFRDHPALEPSRSRNPGRSATSPVYLNIQCDIPTFSWLLKWVTTHDDPGVKPEEKPQLDVANVTSILISSHFLGMRGVTTAAIQFFSQNLGEIARQPIDFNCISDELIRRIARQMDLSTLKSTVIQYPGNILVMRTAAARNLDAQQIIQNSKKQETTTEGDSRGDYSTSEPYSQPPPIQSTSHSSKYSSPNQMSGTVKKSVRASSTEPPNVAEDSKKRTETKRAHPGPQPEQGDNWFDYEYHGSLPFSRRVLVGSGRVIKHRWQAYVKSDDEVDEAAERRLNRDARRDEDEFHRPSNFLQKLIADTTGDS